MSTKSSSYKLSSVQWDCPAASCDGWLDCYGHETGANEKPVVEWVSCSKKCGEWFMISKYAAKRPCSACGKAILKASFSLFQIYSLPKI